MKPKHPWAMGALLAMAFCPALAFDCPAPKPVIWSKFVSDSTSRGGIFAMAELEQALPVARFDQDFGIAILRLKILQIWPAYRAGQVAEEDSSVFVRYPVWIDGSGKDYIFGPNAISA